jgi:hypothetical protein
VDGRRIVRLLAVMYGTTVHLRQKYSGLAAPGSPELMMCQSGSRVASKRKKSEKLDAMMACSGHRNLVEPIYIGCRRGSCRWGERLPCRAPWSSGMSVCSEVGGTWSSVVLPGPLDMGNIPPIPCLCGMARMRNHAGVGGFEEARFSFGHHSLLGPTVFGTCVGVLGGMLCMACAVCIDEGHEGEIVFTTGCRICL